MGKIYDDDFYDVPTWEYGRSISEAAMSLKTDDDDGDLVIPAHFDLRDKGVDSPVKDKGKGDVGIGICWLFAAIAALESHLLYKGKTSSEKPITYQFSELHGAYETFDISDMASENKEKYVNPHGIKPAKKDNGKPGYGGSRYLAVNYLTNKLGVVSNVIDPYYKGDMIDKNTGKTQYLPLRLWDITNQKCGSVYVRGVRYIQNCSMPDEAGIFILTLKMLILKYGGIACSLYWDDKYLSEDGKSYYNNEARISSNHAVTIIGWDDGYETKNFNEKYIPKSNGAFLVKNCWGEAAGGGYLWVSYECKDFAMNSYCITDADEKFFENYYRLLQLDNYGLYDYEEPYTDKTYELTAKNVFSSEENDELCAVSFYACQSCYADIYYTTDKDAEEYKIVENFSCPYAGYYTYDLEKAVELGGKPFSIIIKYKSDDKIHIPLEYKLEEYTHWNIKAGETFLRSDDSDKWSDITKIDTDYGHLCLRAIVKNESKKAAYDAVVCPEIHGTYTEFLPNEAAGLPVSWWLEPYRYSDYGSKHEIIAAMYQITNGKNTNYGLAYVGGGKDKEATAYLTAIIDGSLRKIVGVKLNPMSKYDKFSCTKVKDHENVTNIKEGKFEFDGVEVTVSSSASDKVKKTTVKDGKWEIEDFPLYDPSKGWKDEYSKVTVTVTITAPRKKEDNLSAGEDDSLILTVGKKELTLKCPYDEDDKNYLVYTGAGFIALLALFAAGACIVKKIKICCGFRMIARAGYRRLGHRNMDIDGNNQTVYYETDEGSTSFIDEAHDVENLNVDLRMRRTSSAGVQNEAVNVGGIVRKISSGGSVKNCSVTGEIDGYSGVGGLLYEGENVTVENCSVDLNVTNCSGAYAGAALSLTGGENKISGVSVSGKAEAETVSGILHKGEGAAVSDCRVTGVFIGDKGAYGISASDNSSVIIKNCYTACRLTADSKSGEAFGIGKGFENSPESVSNCVSVCSHLSGKTAARISPFSSTGCIAYDSMTCDGNFVNGSEALKPAKDFLSKNLYELLGWNFSLWEMGEKAPYPILKKCSFKPTYDYPFPYPLPNTEGRYVYEAGKNLTLLGYCNKQICDSISWGITPADSLKNALTGGVMKLQDDSFYIVIPLKPDAGNYRLTIMCVAGKRKYGTDILLEVR